MVWDDGTVFTGFWRNDMRSHGRLIMNNMMVYTGRFENDHLNGPNEQLLLPSGLIYEGELKNGKTTPLGIVMF